MLGERGYFYNTARWWETAASRSSQQNIDGLFCAVWKSRRVFSPAALQSNQHLLHSADLLTVRTPSLAVAARAGGLARRGGSHLPYNTPRIQ